MRIERLFFRQWHDNEAHLRTFVANAGHFERRQALIEAATRQFHRFTQTSAALFWRDAQGDYRLECASPAWPLASIDADDPALTEARARREVVYPVAVGSTLTAELMLPVSDHGQVIALILIAPKPNGIGYRPDEVEVLGWAAQQVGIDLQSMRSRDLEDEVGELRLRLGVLAELLGPRQLLPAAIG